MKLQIINEIEFVPKLLKVQAQVRYWGAATINGVEDKDGILIPFRKDEKWCPWIDVEKGIIVEWPKGKTANIAYKVCDMGEYWLVDDNKIQAKWIGDYVPDKLLCHGSTGYGDYIILSIDGDGRIKQWRPPKFNSKDWRIEVGK